MKKLAFLVLLCGIFSILFSSCNSPLHTPENSRLTPTAPANISLIPRFTSTITPPELVYLGNLMMFPNREHHSYLLDYRLSPNGYWVLSSPDPIELGKDYLQLLSVENWNKEIDISIGNDLLGLPPEATPLGNIFFFGSLSSDSTTWSPDSKALLAMGPAFKGKPYTFLIIFDISDPNNIGKAVVKWEYEGMPYLAWAPDSSRLLIWFGPEIPMGKAFSFIYTEKAWIVDRQGNVLKELDVEGLRSPLWVDNQIFAMKDNTEIWRLDPDKNSTEKLYTNDHPIKKILDHNKENSQLLLIESEAPFDLLVFDIQSQQIIDRIPSQMAKAEVNDCYGISSSSHYTGISGNSFFVFDWITHTMKYYGDYISSPFWSPVVNGFIVERVKLGVLDIIYP